MFRKCVSWIEYIFLLLNIYMYHCVLLQFKFGPDEQAVNRRDKFDSYTGQDQSTANFGATGRSGATGGDKVQMVFNITDTSFFNSN